MESSKLSTKQYVKKNGEVVIKQYDQKEYNKKFYEKNKEKYSLRNICDCGGSYTAPNKSKHDISRIHKLYEKYKKVNI